MLIRRILPDFLMFLLGLALGFAVFALALDGVRRRLTVPFSRPEGAPPPDDDDDDEVEAAAAAAAAPATAD